MSTFIHMERLSENKDQKHNANTSIVNLLTLNFATWLSSPKDGAQDVNYSFATISACILLEYYLYCDFLFLFCAIFFGIKLGNKCNGKCVLFFKCARTIFLGFDNCVDV